MINLKPGNLTIEGNAKPASSVGQYAVQTWTISRGTGHGGGTGVFVTVKLGRNIGSIILVTYLPTILINIINQATNYMKAHENRFEITMTINITSMMVLASIYLSVSASLTPTAAIKPIEVWLLFNIVYPFMVIMINMIIQVVFPCQICHYIL